MYFILFIGKITRRRPEKISDCSTPLGCNTLWKYCIFKCKLYYILIYSHADWRCSQDSLGIMRAVSDIYQIGNLPTVDRGHRVVCT